MHSDYQLKMSITAIIILEYTKCVVYFCVCVKISHKTAKLPSNDQLSYLLPKAFQSQPNEPYQ